MKQRIEKRSESEIRQDFPIAGGTPGWFFRIQEVSAGVYRAEGSDLWGRMVSRSGLDPDLLLVECERDARRIQDELS